MVRIFNCGSLDLWICFDIIDSARILASVSPENVNYLELVCPISAQTRSSNYHCRTKQNPASEQHSLTMAASHLVLVNDVEAFFNNTKDFTGGIAGRMILLPKLELLEPQPQHLTDAILNQLVTQGTLVYDHLILGTIANKM